MTKEVNLVQNDTLSTPARRPGRLRRTAAVLAFTGLAATGCSTLVEGQAEPARAAATSSVPGPNAQAMPHISMPTNVEVNGQPELVTPDLCGAFMMDLVRREADVPPDYKAKITCTRKSFPGAITSATYAMPTYTPSPNMLDLTHLKNVTLAFYRDGTNEGSGSIIQNFIDQNHAINAPVVIPQGDRVPCAELRQVDFYTDMCSMGRGQGPHAAGRLDVMVMGQTTPGDPQAMGELRGYAAFITGNAINIGTA